MTYSILKTLTILYVEDESSLQQQVTENLTPFVKKIITAKNGLEGIQLFEAQEKNGENFDLVITDITMPIMNGIDMVDLIRQHDSAIPIIYTTAYSDIDYMQKTISQSASGYIIKPINIENLLEAIKNTSLQIENKRLQYSLEASHALLETEVKRKTEALRETNHTLQIQLLTDSLTGIPNRAALREAIDAAKKPALILINLDAFRAVNELYGEIEGNHVLKYIAQMMMTYAQGNHRCGYYRVDGDTFAFLESDAHDPVVCKAHIKRFLTLLSHEEIPIASYRTSLHLTATVGVAIGDKKHLMEQAGMTLKRAKKEGKDFLLYDPSFGFGETLKNDIRIIEIVRRALDNNQVLAYVQPIVDREGHPTKYEALIRIQDADELYSPYEFLEIAKKAKLYTQLTHAVIDQAFDIVKQRQCSISINLTIQDIENPDMITWIKQKLTHTQLGHLITFEIVESENIRNYEEVIKFMSDLRHYGCQIALDDFGSGYSNFSYLLRLKPDYIKIDGSLVRHIDTDENARLIVSTINTFIHTIGAKSIAEFVHSETIFNLLLEMGVDEFQGYYFSEPRPNSPHILAC
jgi:diguanylate cyclase (GGDEF)-like protein